MKELGEFVTCVFVFGVLWLVASWPTWSYADRRVDVYEVMQVTYKCEDHGYKWLSQDVSSYTLTCNNGAEFYIRKSSLKDKDK